MKKGLVRHKAHINLSKPLTLGQITYILGSYILLRLTMMEDGLAVDTEILFASLGNQLFFAHKTVLIILGHLGHW